MIFRVIFSPTFRSPPCDPRIMDVPIEADSPDHALEIFEKYLGNPFGYSVKNVSVVGYE